MPEHHDELGTREFAGEFHTTQDVFIQNIPSYADAENISQALIKNQFGRGPRISATQDGCKRKLSRRSLIDLLQQVAVRLDVHHESFIAFLQDIKGEIGSKFILG